MHSQQQQKKVILSQLINNIQMGERVSQRTINSYVSRKNGDISSCITLMSILYNIHIEELQNRGFNNTQNKVYIKGYILGQFAKTLHLPAPACYLLQFDYPLFQLQCQRTNLQQLSRHSKGLFPKFYYQEHLLFHFLPIFHMLPKFQLNDDNQIGALGNRSWQTSREVVKAYYFNRLKKQQAVSWQPQFHNMKNMIRLCYIFLLGLEGEMEELLLLLETRAVRCYNKQRQFSQKESREFSYYLRLWFRNYKKYLDQGIDIYMDRVVEEVYVFEPSNSGIQNTFHLDIISNIRDKVHSLSPNQSPNFQLLLKHLKTLHTLYPCQTQDQLLLLSFLQGILLKLTSCPKQSSILLPTYFQLTSNITDQYFDRLFSSQQQILEQYRNGIRTRIPELPYSQNLMKKIYEYCFKFNYQLYLNDDRFLESKFERLEVGVRMEILTQNCLVGSMSVVERAEDGLTYGEKILGLVGKLDLLSNMDHNQIAKFQNRYGKYFKKNLKLFYDLWQQYYKLMKEGTSFDLINLLTKSKQADDRIQATLNDPIENKKRQIQNQRASKIDIQGQNHPITQKQRILAQQLQQLQTTKNITYKFKYPSNSSQAIDNILKNLLTELNKKLTNISKGYLNLQQMQKYVELISNDKFNDILLEKGLANEEFKRKYFSCQAKLILYDENRVRSLLEGGWESEVGGVGGNNMDVQERGVGNFEGGIVIDDD